LSKIPHAEHQDLQDGVRQRVQRLRVAASAEQDPHYIAKAEKKGCTKAEVHAIIHWLTGYDERALQQLLANKTDFETSPLRRDATSSPKLHG